jgi:peroxiredoxin
MHMKRIILVLLMIAPLATLAQQSNNRYVIKGTFENTKKSGKVFLTYNAKGTTQKDSAKVINGKFEMNGNITAPSRASIEFISNHSDPKARRLSKDMKIFYVEPATIVIATADSLKRAKITGSQTSDDEIKLISTLAPVNAKTFAERTRYTKIEKEGKKTDSLKKEIESALVNLAKERTTLVRDFIKSNPDSYLSLWAIRDIAGAYLDGEEAPTLLDGLSARIKNTADGKEFQRLIKGVERTRIGKIAPEFVQPDTSGKLFKLSDFKGKYVLVDFWASWCHPCREENPRVLKAYNRFKEKGFTVVGISIDQDKMRSQWLKAINEDGMPWTQLVDPAGDAKGAAVLYGVKAIPSNFLIGPDGKIIARNLRGDNLEKTLENILH